MFRPNASSRELVWLGRLMVLVVAAVALLLASDPKSAVLELVKHAWAGFGAAFGPLIILSLYWKKLSEWGAFLGMVTGAVVVGLWASIDVLNDTGLYELIPGFIASMIVSIVASLIIKPSKEGTDAFERSHEAYINER